MTTKFGHSRVQWEQAKDEVRETLIERAREHAMITYTELTEHIAAIDVDPHDYAPAHLLGEVSADDYRHGRGMRSALVVYKDDVRPGPGFFELAEQLGIKIGDRLEFWVKEVQRVYADGVAPN